MFATREVPRRARAWTASLCIVLLGTVACSGDSRPAEDASVRDVAAAPERVAPEAAAAPLPEAQAPGAAASLPGRTPAPEREAMADSPDGAAAAGLHDPVAIPAGTVIRARVETGVALHADHDRGRFQSAVAEEVLAEDGMVLIPEGARIEGWVQRAETEPASPEDGARGEPAGRLVVSLDHIVIDGERYALDATLVGAVSAPPSRSLQAAADSAEQETIEPVPRGVADSATQEGVDPMREEGVDLSSIRSGSVVMIRLERPVTLDSP